MTESETTLETLGDGRTDGQSEMGNNDQTQSTDNQAEKMATETSAELHTVQESTEVQQGTEGISSDASGKSSPVEMCLTKEMVEEEEKLEKKLQEEEDKIEERMEQNLQKANEELRQKRFQRLEFLLQKSNLYANYLLSRMTKQQVEEKEKEERRRKRIATKLDKARRERDHQMPSTETENPGRKTRSKDVESLTVDDKLQNQDSGENGSKKTDTVKMKKSPRKSRETTPDENCVLRRSPRRSITPEPNPNENEKLALRRSPRRSLTPEVPETKRESPVSRRKSGRISKANSPIKSEASQDSQITSRKGSSRNNSRCSTPSLKLDNVTDKENSGTSSPSGRSTRSRPSTPQVEQGTKRRSSARSQQSSRSSTPIPEEQSQNTENAPESGGVSANKVKEKLGKMQNCKVLLNNTVKLNSGETNGKNDTTPGKRGRKRKMETVEKYKISDYFTEAYARAKKAKEEQTEFENGAVATKATENRDVSMETDEDKENQTVEQSVPEILVTCDDKGEAEKSSKDTEGDEEMEKPPRIINGETAPDDQPTLLTGGVLRDYQMEGFKWLKIIYENGINGILADEMGLGKTIQCIALISHIVHQGIVGPFLVCAPLSTVPNWVSEFQRFAPSLPVMLYHGTKQERENLRGKLRKMKKVQDKIECFHVVVTSYEIVMNDRKFLQYLKWKFIIVDEGHRLKNFQCKLIQELKLYQSTHRLLLTGTPLQNNLSELWSLLNFLLPEIFDDLSSFEMWFDVRHLESAKGSDEIVKDEQQNSVLTMLHQILNPFMLRRMKCDVELGVPPKREVLVYAQLSARQKEIHKAICDNTIRKLVGVEEEEHVVDLDVKGRPKRHARKLMSAEQLSSLVGTEQTQCDSDSDEDDTQEDSKINSWAELAVMSGGFGDNFTSVREQKLTNSEINLQMKNVMMILRKCTNHPYLIEYPLTPTGAFQIDNALVETSGKLALLDKMMLEMKKRNHKVLLFSQMTKILDILEDYCYLRKFTYCRLDGSMKVDERKEQIESFNTDPEVFVFLLSTRAGGLGLNLTAADTVIIFDSDWNPQNDLQAQDRAHRIGQKKPVMVYRMVTAGTIDQKIVERAAAKRKLEKMVIHKGRFKDASMERMTAKLQPLNSEELVKLLQSVDYDDVVQGRDNQVISKRDLNNLLDRSDLWAQMKQRQNKKKKPTQEEHSQDNNNNSDAEESEETELEKIEEILSTPKQKSKSVFKIVDDVAGDHFI